MQRFKNILFVLDNSPFTGAAIQRAVELASTNKAKLTIIDIIPVSPIGRSLQSLSEKVDMMRKELINERKIEMEETLYGYLGDQEVTIEVLPGKPFFEIIQYVIRNNCDLVIKSAEQDNLLPPILFGSTDLKLLRKCPCPVWIVKPDDHPPSRRILAAVELESSDENLEIDVINRQIVEITSSLAQRESAQLHIVHAFLILDGGKLAQMLSKHFEEDSIRWVEEQKRNIDALQKSFEKMFKKHLDDKNIADLEYNFHFLEGEAEDVIVDLVQTEKIDLVVMGTVGRSDLAGLLIGNTSEAILSRIQCSVLAIKPPGFVSPIAFHLND